MKKNLRKIAIFTDVHGLLEPMEAILEDIQKRKITEIYSLGDNIGVGPNSKEVMELIQKYHVVSVAGNAEDYITFGIEPFSYIRGNKKESYLWTCSQLDEPMLEKIKKYPYSLELELGNKKIGLCHFSNDVRFDYIKNSVFKYQEMMKLKRKAYRQFLYTNSKRQKRLIKRKIKKLGRDDPKVKVYESALEKPLFGGKKVTDFDIIIQGHTHFKFFEETKKTKFYTIRAVGMAYGEDASNLASYIVVTEKENGVSIEEVLVEFNRLKMLEQIQNSTFKDDRIYKYVGINPKNK